MGIFSYFRMGRSALNKHSLSSHAKKGFYLKRFDDLDDAIDQREDSK